MEERIRESEESEIERRILGTMKSTWQNNMKGSSDNATTPESKEVLMEEVQPVEGGTGLQGEKHGLKMVDVNDNAVSSSKADDEMEKNQALQKDTMTA
ncbi:hypothetical protein Peur_033575 [Populus x canadensis]